ncbi:MAG: CPBP family intramembrane metalloprotease [Acidimicrobiales bacterium]|nr:CPBP family intramembrane metalloprotease [Acidimicrobiales bacterium]
MTGSLPGPSGWAPHGTADPPRSRAALAILIGGLTGANIARTMWVPGPWHFWFNLGIGAFSAGVAIGARVTRDELGLARDRLRRGLSLGGRVAGAIAVGVVALGAAGLLTDERTEVSAASMATRTLVLIPLGTVLVEEMAFRGSLHALLGRFGRGPTLDGPRLLRGATALQWIGGSILFGLWHTVPALRGGGIDSDVVEVSSLATALATTAATTVAGAGFIWLRVRSGSLLAPVLVHLATNSVTFAVAWAF